MLFFSYRKISKKKEFIFLNMKEKRSCIQLPKVCDTHAVNTLQVWAQTLNWTVKQFFVVHELRDHDRTQNRIESESYRYCVYWNRNAKAIATHIWQYLCDVYSNMCFIIQNNTHTHTHLPFTDKKKTILYTNDEIAEKINVV